MKSIKVIDRKNDLTTVSIVTLVATNARQTGVKIDEMRQRLRILDAVEKANGAILIEDSDYALLSRLVKEFPFALCSRDLVDVIDGILGAETTDVTPKKAKAN